MMASDRRFRRAFLNIGATALALLVLLPGRALAVSRTCGTDFVANTTNVLCAAPSGPCTGIAVTMSSDIEVTTGSCTFDLGGRTLSIQKNFQITGLGTFKVINAGDITITGTGRIKSRGDFVEPNGFVIRGGIIDLTSSGVITLLDRAQIDVSGDSAGTIRLTANGVNGAGVGIDFKATAQIFGQGFSMADEGERYSDGGALNMRATSGGIADAATIFISGANQAQGGAVDMRAARNLVIDDVIDASGGGSDGGSIDLLAGDNIIVNKQLNADSRTGGGYGGTMSMTAGLDLLGGIVPGGGVTINNTQLEMNGSDAETSGGDGGELDISALGNVTITGAHAAIRASGGTLFDGSGGAIAIASGDSAPSTIGSLDGDLTVAGDITAQSGGTDGDGGIVDLSAGRALSFTATIDVSGKSTGGDVTGDAGTTVLLNGMINAQATNTLGGGGYIDFSSGLASNSGLTLAQNINAVGGTSNGSGQSISLAGCTVTVNTNIKIDGHAGVSAFGSQGGSDIDLISRGVMHLNNGSQYLAQPGGVITTTHPASQVPVIGTGVVFNPGRTDHPTNVAPYPNCPVCGDGTRQLGEGCDDGGLTAGDGCSPTCTVESGWSCTGSAPSVCTPICGNGVRQGNEECDDGNLTSGDGCDSNCTTSRCGNGAVGAPEQCDDGNLANGDGCSSLCVVEPGYNCNGQPSQCVLGCGDGILAPGEECDDSNLVSGDGCDANCTITRCGNGIVTAGEQCEDGNTLDGDCCSSTCQFESVVSTCATDGNACTNDVCNGAGACIHVNNTASCNDGNACTTGDACSAGSCVGGPALSCDDGNVCSNDSCAPATGCVHTANALTCNDGQFCTINDVCAAMACSGTPRNCADTNGCTADSCDETADQCVHDPVPLNGTTCNDGQFCTVNDACQAGACTGGPRDCSAVADQCHLGVCNETNDLCVSQTRPNGTACNDGQQCTITDQCQNGTCSGNTNTCGDGTPQTACGETCDDGNQVNGDGCDNNCTPSACGNGIVAGGEQCDDGDLISGDGCSSTCTVEPGWSCSGQPSVCHANCGDGTVAGSEQCDDGNVASRDGCSSTCQFELCRSTPATGCRRPAVAAKASVQMKKQASSSSDVLLWKWLKGTATTNADFGSPTSSTSYAICLYDESGPTPQLKLSALAPAGGFCSGNPCWKTKTGGYSYSDKDLTPHGVNKLTLKSGPDEIAKITLKAKGFNLALPSLSVFGQPLLVQLRNSNGTCWEAVYSAPASKNDATQFKDKAD